MLLRSNYWLYLLFGGEGGRKSKKEMEIMIKENISVTVIKIQSINFRLIRITLKLEEIVCIVEVYGPVEDTNDQKVSEIYKVLQNVLDELKEIW